MNTGKIPVLRLIPASPKRDNFEHLKSFPMFDVSGNFPGLKFKSQTNLFLFPLFFPRCLLVVRVEDRLLGQMDPWSDRHSILYTLILQYVSQTTLSQAVQKVFALSFSWLCEVYYSGNYARNCTK